MTIQREDIGHVSVLRPRGRITIGDGDIKLREAIDEALEAGQRHLLLDMEQVRYLDSAGLGELVACGQRTRAAGGVVKLLKPTRQTYGLLEMTRIQSSFEIFEGEREALVSFRALYPRAV